MKFSDIKTWVVGPDNIARPKNPNRKATERHFYKRRNEGESWGDYYIKLYNQFEKEAQQHHYAVDESLTPGEYDASVVELIDQWRHLHCDWTDGILDNEIPNIGYLKRKLLRLKKKPESPKFGEWVDVNETQYFDKYDQRFKELHSGIHNLVSKFGWKDFFEASITYQDKKVDSNYKITYPKPSPPKSK